MKVTFLTPRLPPHVCGVGDQTAKMAQELVRHGLRVGFVHRDQQTEFDLPDGPVDYWDGREKALARCIARQNPDWLWVQVSGYGYSRWGAPYRLACGLRWVRRQLPRIRIAVCLHEPHCLSYQLGWKGWVLSPWQRYTIGEVLRQGDLVLNTNPVWMRWAREWYRVPSGRLFLLPIGSAIPAIPLSATEREEQRRRLGWEAGEVIAVIFGSYGMQQMALEQFEPLLQGGLRKGRLHRVVCVGGSGPAIPAQLASWATRLEGRLTLMGSRPALEIGTLLACSDVGLAATPRPVLMKSSGFMAMAAAGLPVIASSQYPAEYQLEDDLPVFLDKTWDWREASSPRVQEQGRELQRIYRLRFDWPVIAQRVLDLLQGGKGRPEAARGMEDDTAAAHAGHRTGSETRR